MTDVQQVTAEIKRWVSTARFSLFEETFANRETAVVRALDATDDLVMHFDVRVLSRELAKPPKEIYRYRKFPQNWWEHLKLSLPGWVRRRWPVRLVDYPVSIAHHAPPEIRLCPHVKINKSDAHLRFLAFGAEVTPPSYWEDRDDRVS